MALDAVGLQQPLRYTVDLKEGLTQQPMRSQLMKGDKKANRVIVRITNGSETVDLAGVGVSGSFIRPPDEAELTLAGTANGNEAVIVLEDACYAEEGYCEIDVKLTVNGASRTILALTGYVLAKGKGAYIDVGDAIPNIDDIIAQYAEMKAVTERTLAAAQRAEALAINASGYAANTGMLGGQPPSYYATAEQASQLSQQIAEKLSMELLWENASPTSTFEAKTITPGVAIPETYMIVFRITSAGSARAVGPICVGKGVGYYAYSTNYAGLIASRQFVMNASSIQFFAGQISSEYGTLTENNNYMIPLYIYGIRGVE